MSSLKPMDPKLIRKLLENQRDILTTEVKAEEALYRHTQCPICGSTGCEKRIQPPKIVLNSDGTPMVLRSPFGSGPLPEGHAHCLNCGTNFNPHTGMIFQTEASMIHGPE